MVMFQQYLVFVVSAIFLKLRNNSAIVSPMIGFINTIHCVLKTTYVFFIGWSLTNLLLALLEFFSSEFGKWLS